MLNRIFAILLRFIYLHRRSLPRMMEIVFWPTMSLLLWGFLSVYFQKVAAGVGAFLLGAMLFWELLYRAQQSISLAITEEFWVRNLLNLFISPLRISELVAGVCLVGLMKTALTTTFLIILSIVFFDFNILRIGWAFPLLYGALLLFGWSLGLCTMGVIFRYGRAAEALIWGVPFLIQPLSAVFYPVSILPPWLQTVSYCLPSTYVFEGMRAALQTGALDVEMAVWAYCLNIPWLLGGGALFGWMLKNVRQKGILARQTMD